LKRQLVLVTHYYSTHCGGVEKVAAELASRLADAHRLAVTWMASDADPLPEGFPDALRLLPARAWNGIERRTSVPWPVWSPSALYQLWRVISQANAVHLHDALYFGNAFAWLFARLQGVPLIVTQHVGNVPFRSAFLRAIHAFANRTLGRLVLSTAHQVVFISPSVRLEFERFCRFRAPPVYWPNGVDTETFTPDGAVADDQKIVNAHRAGKHVFLFVGRFVEKKGLSVLREITAALSDDLWIFAGQGPLDPGQWGLSNVLVVRGESGQGLARYYRAADLLVLPSVGEGFPLVVQEAMACGTPAMVGEETASGCPDARHLMLIEHVGTEETAARWMRRLSDVRGNPGQLLAMRADVAKYAHDHWSWKLTAAKYAELFDAIRLRSNHAK
jgi:glycosyltransferase involved in cell wall biosynthesis